MKTVEMVSHMSRPIDDREGHLPFEPFSPAEWVATILLVLFCFGLPLGMILHYKHEMAQLDKAAVRVVAHE